MNKRLFGKIFLDPKELQMNGTFYPIIVEYYITENETEMSNLKYGIEVVKTEFLDEEIKEVNKIDNVCSNEAKTNEILSVLLNGEVTPTAVQDVLDDLLN